MRLVKATAVVALAAFVLTGLSSAGSAGSITPNAVNMLDCNGWSTSYTSVRPAMQALCTDPFKSVGGVGSRFFDNSWYVGHDEPTVKFISSAPNSGNTMSYDMQLATDPTATPTPNGSVTDYAELSAAPWFGLPICDPNSYPQNPCTPDSDTNTGTGSPNDAGSAFMELQFYPPGFGPFNDAVSCSQTQYCAALTIDSLECSGNFASCNNSCIEPVNFAYLQKDGSPAGPPSPQQANSSSFTPNGETLLMNPGDSLKVAITDPAAGLTVRVTDLTTGESGYMVASAGNGFANTSISNCSGTPFTFHAEYATAAQQNQVPWAALEGGVLMEQEIGHFESCNSVSNSLGYFGSADTNTFQTCTGGVEPNGTGEGPCSGAACTGPPATTDSSCVPFQALCEFSDAICVPAGARSAFGGTWDWPVAGCMQNFTQNGDLDFDGNPYRSDWPDGSSNHPTSFVYAGPFDSAGNPYPSIQFETDVGGSTKVCDIGTGKNCTAPPPGAAFYPFWSIGKQKSAFKPGHSCLWNFGNDISGVTRDDFGGASQYGQPDTARYGGTLTSAVMPNPQLTANCKGGPNGPKTPNGSKKTH